MEKIADGESADRSLLAAKPADRGVSAPELASEKNQEMDRMLGRRTIPADYAATMRALHGDSKQDKVGIPIGIFLPGRGLTGFM